MAMPPRLLIFLVATLTLAACVPAAAPTRTASTGTLVAQPASAFSSPAVPGGPTIKALTGPIPFPIEQNVGQFDASVDYLLRAGSVQVGFGVGGPRLVLTDRSPEADPACTAPARDPRHPTDPAACPTVSYALRLGFVGADTATPVGMVPAATLVSRFVGSEDQWQAGIPAFEQVAYPNAWPGIDVLYERAPGAAGLKSGYRVAPGADPEMIRLAWDGAESAMLDETGALVLTTPVGTVREAEPVAWQDRADGGRDPVAAQFALLADGKDGTPIEVGFKFAAYDHSRPFTIDPVLAYSSYLGGSGNDYAYGVAVDSSGAAYVVGITDSPDFPTTAGTFNTISGLSRTRSNPSTDAIPPTISQAFVVKVNPGGSGLVYASYLGGYGVEAYGVAVDASGAAYVVGYTYPTNSPTTTSFPTSTGAYQTTFGGGSGDAFVAKVNPVGSSLVYASYLGGTGQDVGSGVAVDATGAAYVVGQTNSPNFPATPGAFDTTYGEGVRDAFVTKINPVGSALVYSSYLGSSGSDEAHAVAVDSHGTAYVVGVTNSIDFPTTIGAFQTTHGGGAGLAGVPFDAFVVKVNLVGSTLVYASYLGGSGSDAASSVAVDSIGAAYVVGTTSSTNFPTTAGAFNPAYNGGFADGFVAKVNPAGSTLLYASYLGGSGGGGALGVAIDSSGAAYVVGRTFFVTKVNPAGSALLYASYLGGPDGDYASGVAVDGSGAAYVVGLTNSAKFPTTPGAFQRTPGGGTDAHGLPRFDAFVARVLDLSPTPTPTVCAPRPSVGVNAVAVGSGQLRATISSGVTPGTPDNRLLSVRATIPSNALVDVQNGPQGLAGTVNLPVGSGTQPVVFVVRRITPGAVHVPLLITDTCGEWPSFVGGGPSAF